LVYQLIASQLKISIVFREYVVNL